MHPQVIDGKCLAWEMAPESVPAFDTQALPGLWAGPAPDAAGVELPEGSPISNQGPLPFCVSNALCDAAEIAAVLAGHPLVQLSRSFNHWHARNYHGRTQELVGTWVTYAIRALYEHGVCAEDDWAYDETRWAERPDLSALQAADSNKDFEAAQIKEEGTERVLEVERLTMAGYPVVFGTLVDRAFLVNTGELLVTPPRGDTAGGHAMVVVGVRRVSGRRQFKIRNSWGVGWRKDGYVWMDESYISWVHTSDLWAIRRGLSRVQRSV
jgi:hypothetical protein